MELIEENGKLDFDAFYMTVVDRLLVLQKVKSDAADYDRVAHERFSLNEVREFMEYIEDRELYYGISYKEDVMEFVAKRTAMTGFDLMTIFTQDQQGILNTIYRKDKSVAAKRKKAAG